MANSFGYSLAMSHGEFEEVTFCRASISACRRLKERQPFLGSPYLTAHKGHPARSANVSSSCCATPVLCNAQPLNPGPSGLIGKVLLQKVYSVNLRM